MQNFLIISQKHWTSSHETITSIGDVVIGGITSFSNPNLPQAYIVRPFIILDQFSHQLKLVGYLPVRLLLILSPSNLLVLFVVTGVLPAIKWHCFSHPPLFGFWWYKRILGILVGSFLKGLRKWSICKVREKNGYLVQNHRSSPKG